ncbi:GPP34 family phosphoprotein [Agrococcus jejuensis]|uniref:Golgi phosphoprotein 3 (GPP34) n=1 Tax=Agrococcus jejuensis TaxID=399736 RepID=A0A1G8E310_9MICO|nr:GPP34 family phosphoprotein [Agrococcus jejuensis]SDH64336.1 Golgi phosphoprotein 3 (GPP34) [Agrococcus jejuensis]
MPPLRLLDAVLLLVHDDDTGARLVSDRVWERFLMAVAIVELVVGGAARLEPAHPQGPPIVRATGRPAADPLLARLLADADGRDLPAATKGHDGFLPGMRGLVDELVEARLETLAAAGMLSKEQVRVLGIPVRSDWVAGPRADVEQRLRMRMLRAIDAPAQADDDVVLLFALLHPTGSLPAILPMVDRHRLVVDIGAIVSRTWLAQTIFRLTYVPGNRFNPWLYT